MDTTTFRAPNTIAELASLPRPATSAQQRLSHEGAGLCTSGDVVRTGGPSGISKVMDLLRIQTPDEIADFLRSEHALGHRGSLDSCPIAVWARRAIGECEVNDEGISFSFVSLGTQKDVAVNVNATPAMREFVRRFDADAYPDLVAV